MVEHVSIDAFFRQVENQHAREFMLQSESASPEFRTHSPVREMQYCILLCKSGSSPKSLRFRVTDPKVSEGLPTIAEMVEGFPGAGIQLMLRAGELLRVARALAVIKDPAVQHDSHVTTPRNTNLHPHLSLYNPNHKPLVWTINLDYIFYIPNKGPLKDPHTVNSGPQQGPIKHLEQHRGPKDNVNKRILGSGSKAQDKGDSRNHGF